MKCWKTTILLMVCCACGFLPVYVEGTVAKFHILRHPIDWALSTSNERGDISIYFDFDFWNLGCIISLDVVWTVGR